MPVPLSSDGTPNRARRRPPEPGANMVSALLKVCQAPILSEFRGRHCSIISEIKATHADHPSFRSADEWRDSMRDRLSKMDSGKKEN